MNWKSKRNYKKSFKAQSIYAVVICGKWCVRSYKFTGKWEWDERCKEWVPLVYHHIDFNGTCDEWVVTKITDTTSGVMVNWTFNRDRADAWVWEKKILEEVNYGKVFCK